MEIKQVVLDAHRIVDWTSFHSVFANLFGFPPFYGANMNAWIDCMTDLDDESGLTDITVAKGGCVVLQIDNVADFRDRCPEQYEALIECTAFVNYRRVETGGLPILALMPIGFFRRPVQLGKVEEIAAIIDRVANRSVRDGRSGDEIIGYDENGLPS